MRSLAFLLVLTLAATAQTDAPPPDVAQILEVLKALRTQQTQQIRSAKQKALQDANAAAASPAAAAAAWVEAIRQTQFAGAEKEGAQFRDWRDKDGAAFADKEVQYAAQLYFRWLALTLRRSLGTTTKELLPEVIQFTKDVAADQMKIEVFAERAQKNKELAQSRMHGLRRDTSGEDARTQRMHDMVLGRGLAGSAPVKAMNLDELLKVENWEMTPGDVEGIFTTIVLPELRLAKDPRIFEYWDMKIKKEADAVKDRPAYEQEQFVKERRPILLWNRAQEYLALGQRNRGISEMFQIIRGYTQHPNLANWIGALETLLAPPAPSAAPAPAPAPLPGA
jgi:hypothetical protein